MPVPNHLAVNALGRALAKSDAPTADQLTELSEIEARYLPSLEKVAAIVRKVLGDPPAHEGVRLTVGTRPLKTVGTIIEKMRRDKTRLSTMQDIAGLRIVGESGLTCDQQDRLAERLAATFDSPPKRVDRRADPSFGYRALHLVVEADGYPVEIQIRTDLQHMWADVMEKIGDLWGRSVRYGGVPDATGETELKKRVAIVEAWKELADLVAAAEEDWDVVAAAQDRLVEAEHAAEDGGDEANAAVETARSDLDIAKRHVSESFGVMRAEIERIRKMAESDD